MSQSSGILFASLGENLMKFADIQHSTKISSLEAEAQRRKELRLQEMQLSQNDITNAFRVADYESSQERLGIAKESAQLAKDKFDYEKEQDLLPDYHWTKQNVYGHYTEEVKDELSPTGYRQEQQWGIVAQRSVGINKKDPDDIRILNPDGTMTRGTTADVEVDLLEGIDADVLSKLKSKFRSIVGEDPTDEQIALAYQTGVANGSIVNGKIVDESAADTPPAAEAPAAEAPSAAAVAKPDPNVSTNQLSHSIYDPPNPLGIKSSPEYKAGSALAGGIELVADAVSGLQGSDIAAEIKAAAEKEMAEKKYFAEYQINPSGARTFDPSDGMGVNTSSQTGSFPAINTGGQAVPELPPSAKPTVVSPTQPFTMSEAYGYNAEQSKNLVERLIKDLEAADVPKDIIQKSLMNLLGQIPTEQANGEFAKELATAYYEFTKGSN